MRGRRRRHLSSLLLVVTLAGCGSQADASLPWPIQSDIGVNSGRMVVNPVVAEPGDLVELTFPTGHDRGLLFALDVPVSDGWQRRAMLRSDANGGEPKWAPADGEDLMVEMIGIAGGGPDRVPIPDGLPGGDYRICTANAVENLCVPIEIVAP